MGGRGNSGSSSTLTKKQERKLEDIAQQNDTKFLGWRNRAKYYEYTDSKGKKHTGETRATGVTGGTYRAKFNEQVERYSKMSTSALEKERDSLKARSTEEYQKFYRSSVSRSASQVSSFADADSKVKMINQVLRIRKKKE